MEIKVGLGLKKGLDGGGRRAKKRGLILFFFPTHVSVCRVEIYNLGSTCWYRALVHYDNVAAIKEQDPYLCVGNI